MEPIRVRVSRIMDFGTIVSIIGVDLESNKPVVVHVDHRPFQTIWDTWKAANFPQPIEFDADCLTLNLDIDIDLDADTDDSGPAALPPAA
jgi:hypothetical protein